MLGIMRQSLWCCTNRKWPLQSGCKFDHNYTLEITLKIILKKVFQSMIGNQIDLDEILIDNVEMGRSEKLDSR